MKNNIDSFKKFIIVDKEYGQPMSWSREQLCYCTTSYWEDHHHPLEIYTLKRATNLIQKSKKFRKRKGWEVGEYLLVPVKEI